MSIVLRINTRLKRSTYIFSIVNHQSFLQVFRGQKECITNDDYLTKSHDLFIVYENMLQSMTGFGSLVSGDFTVEIRSLNHRFIDISIKMPQFMGQHEIPLRNILKERFQRGRFDVFVSLTNSGATQLKINRGMARNICDALRDLQKELNIPGDVTIDTLKEYREIFMEEETKYDIEALYRAFHGAVSSLEEMRTKEGSLLSEDIRQRLHSIRDMHKKIKAIAPEELVRWREKFIERLQLVLEAGMIDNNRIMQEAALMAEKLDISEEIDRIENHLTQFVEILDKGDIVGKRLDFLLQELNREVNTLAYKSGEYSISKLVVDMKTEIEKVREQVQNLQ